ncbi:hypothetical protein [Anabaena lutea]|uniref:Uncharacterized protein n=1 Tax=Anabaena lutea FACHB-196 TaxID=2692881 RepID=A0ABR8FEE5_9NOST|nr:hypothetical protein [Anabaena lutea]MBD2568353.1 hypothetical protein [Anabaena lutea FACHB-196]
MQARKPYLLLYTIDGKQFAHIVASNDNEIEDKVCGYEDEIKAAGISISEVDIYPFNELVKERLGFNAD